VILRALRAFVFHRALFLFLKDALAFFLSFGKTETQRHNAASAAHKGDTKGIYNITLCEPLCFAFNVLFSMV
jgi:hypothetical protein